MLQRTVLIVDDNIEDCKTLRRSLEQDSSTTYRCHEAHTAAEGLALCRSVKPEVILIDDSLPEFNGLTLLEALFAEHGALAFAVIMLTGTGSEAIATKALKLGAQDYLVKEYDLQYRLLPAIANAIDKVELQHQIEKQHRELEHRTQQLQRALEAQQASETQLRLTLQSARMATWEWELDTNRVIWDVGLEAMLGMSEGTFGGSFAAFQKLLHPDDRELVSQRIDMALRGEAPYEIVFRMLLPNGEVRWTETRGVVVRDQQGAPIRMFGIDMDVTADKQAEAELRASEERYRALVTATSDLVWQTSPAGDLLFISPLWRELTGQSEEELRGWGWAQAIHPADAAQALVGWREALDSHTAYKNEFRIRMRDGSYQRFYIRGVPIIAADGTVREWIGYSRNVTALRQIADELRRSEVQFKTLVENAPDIIARFDRSQRHIYVSPTVERATGLPQASFIGKTNRELGMPAAQCDLWEAQANYVFQTGRPAEYEFTFTTPDGALSYQARLVPEFNEDGSVETLMAISRDITAYKQAEERLHFLADVSKVLTSSLDYRVTLKQIARMLLPYLGDACIIELLGNNTISETVVAHIDPQQEDLLYEICRSYPPDLAGTHPVAQVLRDGQPLIVQKVSQEQLSQNIVGEEHRRLVEHIPPQSYMMVPLIVRNQTIGVLGLYATQAQRRYTSDDCIVLEKVAVRAAIALDNAQLYEEMREAVREREAFLAIASHEIKNPLTALLGRAQLLERRLGRREDSARELADSRSVIDNAQRINQLLTDLLDVSRMTSGQLSVDKEPLDLGALVQRVVANIQSALSDQRVSLVEHEKALTISGDASRLEQVFYNLISNALKYSPASSQVKIDLARQGSSARISVSDQGIGIPATALPDLFKRFFRVPGDSTQQIDGAGIGLYVVKEIVASHSGTVEVQSTEGIGSIFTVFLPIIRHAQ
jgi:PAS domain S-box-containing protein